MTDIRQMVDLYELCDPKRQVAQETGASRNTVKKYLNRVKNVREGKETEIHPKTPLFTPPTPYRYPKPI